MGKRGTLEDFFSPSVKKSKTGDAGIKAYPATQLEYAEVAINAPRGLSIISNFVTIDEEKSILAFLDAQTWRTDLSRRTMHFGGTFCLMPPKLCTPEERKKIEQTILQAPAMPDELRFVVDRMVNQGLYQDDCRPDYCIVNEYLPGQGISAHVENFRFGEPVCSLTLVGQDTIRFHELETAHDGSVRSGKASSAPRTGRREDVVTGKRSLLILRGDARSTWQRRPGPKGDGRQKQGP
ncbi:hypothetical protein KVT40_004487 [Elsinoe batatas]|uniref:Alpha-ketoglutarate-dependent dioxygenase AlkB-like domain-containing protein n=1 Tax=Elsinoe batatas TaxID=2601811 RepID=A0A8K0L515_9PEZI|nr:hypothetical protein KVT40_004487 [Elsinoe batatas]